MPAEALRVLSHVVTVHLPRADETSTTTVGETTAEVAVVKDPSPLTVAPKELFWSLGAFLVLLVLMRLVFYPKLRAGMEARQQHIATNVADASAARDAAQSEVDDYASALDKIRLEAQQRIEAAAREIESARSAKMAEVNAAVATRRAAARAEMDAARQAVSTHVAEAAREVVASAAQQVLGVAASDAAVQHAVERAMSAEVTK